MACLHVIQKKTDQPKCFDEIFLSGLSPIIQGCALTAPGRLRRLTFGFGRVRKISWSPGRALWLIVFLADKAAKYFNMLVVKVYQTSQKMFFFSYETIVTHVTAGGCTNFDSYSKYSIKFGTRSLAFLGYSFKKELLLLL